MKSILHPIDHEIFALVSIKLELASIVASL